MIKNMSTSNCHPIYMRQTNNEIFVTDLVHDLSE